MEKVAFTPAGPPSDLTVESKEIYDFYVGQGIKVRNPGQVAAFIEALRAMDRANEARAILKTDGMVKTSARSKLPRRHPACEILTNAEQHFRRIWKRLGLYGNQKQEGLQFVDIV